MAVQVSGGSRSQRDVSLDYLRATVVLMVVAHHSSLAYTTFAQFDPANMFASTAPVVDTARWVVLDYAENFNDVFFMSLMFFISGVFVWPSLRRSGFLGFLRARLVRLGIPFLVAVALLMPLAYYASFQLTGRDNGYLSFWWGFVTRDGWPPGPLWFVWVLVMFDALAAGVFLVWPRRLKGVPLGWTRRWPIAIALALFVFCVLVYFPGLKAYGFGTWGVLLTPPFYFQLCRLALYLLWFAAGAWLGSDGLERGLLARDAALARHWPWWIAACVITYNLLWFLPMSLASLGIWTQYERDVLWAFLWVASCVASCLGFLALFRGVVRRGRWMESLSRSAYVIYIVHYIYVLWLQRAMMAIDVHASIKFAAVFSGAVLLSWLTAQVLLQSSWLRRFL